MALNFLLFDSPQHSPGNDGSPICTIADQEYAALAKLLLLWQTAIVSTFAARSHQLSCIKEEGKGAKKMVEAEQGKLLVSIVLRSRAATEQKDQSTQRW